MGGLEVVERLAEEWRALCDAGPWDEPFYRPEWIQAYLRAFGEARGIALVTARRSGRLAAVLPLVRDRLRRGSLTLPVLRAAANVHSGRFDMVLRGGPAAEVEATIAAVWAALNTLPAWDLLYCPDVPAGGGIERLARHARALGYPTARRETLRSPYITLPPGTHPAEAVLAGTTAKFRANLRRRQRKLEAAGAVRLVRTSAADPAVLQRFYALEASGWKGAGGTAIVCDPRTRRFYDDLAAACALNGSLRLYGLQCGRETVAMQYGVLHHGRYYLLKPAYDERLGQVSPGHLLVWEVLRDLVGSQAVEFDFLGPWMAWKAAWTAAERPHADYFLFRRTLRSRVLHTLRFRLGPVVPRAMRRMGPRSSAAA